MSYCLNPECQKANRNRAEAKFCQYCGSKLLLGDRYRALELIGQGGFGRTFLAVDEYKPSKPRCVIKQFYPQIQGANNIQKAADLFEQEAMRLDELGQHPQIPELLAHFTQDNRQYLIQEFIDGQNLLQELEAEGVFQEAQIRQLLESLLPVLEFIHSHQVIHRDIKPANIIRRPNRELILVDFGAAKFANETALLLTGTTIGTPGYLAPEQARGKACFASDLYSLGVTCLYLLTQISPLELFDVGEDNWVWRQYLLNNPVSEKLGYILDRLVENGTKKRYQSASEVLRDLESQSPIIHANSPLFRQFTYPKSTFFSTQPSVQLPTLTWKCVQTLKGHSSRVWSVTISPDSQILVSSSGDQTIKLWQLSTGKEIRTLEGHNYWARTLAITPDGQILASGSDDNTIKLWQLSTGKPLRTLKGHSRWVRALAMTPDGQILASASNDKTIKLWQLSTGKEIHTLTGHNDWVSTLTMTPDGQILVSGSNDQTIKLWHVSTGRELHSFTDHSDWVRALAITPDGQILASGSYDQTIKLWQLSTGQELATLKGHTEGVRTLAITPDGQILASGSDDNSIKLWHLS
ncbi:MAG TPA: WD40 repeat domain-containing serine/threonine-protein kinase, partial [Stenomitos sp.]